MQDKYLEELKKLYINLKEVRDIVSKDNQKKQLELNQLQEELERLLYIKDQVKTILTTNSIKANKNLTHIFAALGTISLGACIYFGSKFTNQPSEIVTLIASGTVLYGSSMAGYVSLTGYLDEKKLVRNNNPLYLNPKISELNNRIINVRKEMDTNNKILDRCNKNIPLVKNKIKELSDYNMINKIQEDRIKRSKPKTLIKSKH